MSEKPILVTIGNVRIVQYNELNVMVERYEDVFIPTKKETVKRWRFKGYYNSVFEALKLIQRNELLLDKNDITDLNSYLKAVQESNTKLLEVMKT